MSHYVLRFVEDKVLSVVPKNRTRVLQQPRMVKAPYGRMYYDAVIIQEGSKAEMDVLLNNLKTADDSCGIVPEIETDHMTKGKTTENVSTQAVNAEFMEHAATQTDELELEKTTENVSTQAVNAEFMEHAATQTDELELVTETSEREKPHSSSMMEHSSDSEGGQCLPARRRLVFSPVPGGSRDDDVYCAPVYSPSEEREDGERSESAKKTKQLCCYFCQTLVVKMARHFVQKHRNEMEVARILAITDRKERRAQYHLLENLGNYYYNMMVLNAGKGELLVNRTPKDVVDVKRYKPCPDCLGFYKEDLLWKHSKKCRKTSTDEQGGRRRIIAESNALIAGFSDPNESEGFIRNIITRFINDQISEVCIRDPLIRKLGKELYERKGPRQQEHIRQTMRQLARLVQHLRGDREDGQLSEFLSPEKFDQVINSVRAICTQEVNEESRATFNIPSLGIKLGNTLKKCIHICRGDAIKKGNVQQEKKLKQFNFLMETEFSNKITSTAHATLKIRKSLTEEILPLTDDLIKLKEFMVHEIGALVHEVQSSPTLNNWYKLCTFVLARVVLFNKRRGGEASKMLLRQYQEKKMWTDVPKGEIERTLAPSEIANAEKLSVVHVVGKRSRKVAILLTPAMMESINLLIANRGVAGISPKNNYVFARASNSINNIRGTDAMRKVVEQCPGLEGRSNLKSTKFRKYIATVAQILELPEHQLEWVANHLGHDIRVHREFYRLQSDVVTMAKVSKLLLISESGQLHKYKGKTLDEISVDDIANDEGLDQSSAEESDGADAETSEEEAPPELAIRRRIKRPSQRRPWSREEKAAVLQYFSSPIKHGYLPGKKLIDHCLAKHKTLLRARKWTDVKFCLKNYIAKINPGRKK